MQTNDIITYIFSSLAIVVSICTFWKTNKMTKKIAEKTLNTKFFEELYFEYIITKLPKALLEVKECSSTNLALNCENTQKLVIEILTQSQFYKYFNDVFYDTIKSDLISIEEILTNMQEPKLLSNDIFDYRHNLNQQVNKLYENMKYYYTKI